MGIPGRPKLLARRTRRERQQQRASITLVDASISARTQARYYLAIRSLLPILENTPNLSLLDQRVADWVEKQWEDGAIISFVSDGLCALHHFEPFTKRLVPSAWKLYKTWRRLEAPNRAPPLTRFIVFSIANYAVAHRDLVFAGLLLLGFFAMLRTGELLAVRPKDLILDNEKGLVSLFATKTGQRHAASETVAFHDHFTLDALKELVFLRRSQGLFNVPIWISSASSFRTKFQHHMKRFSLERHCFRPYSMRRGGATDLFQETGSMETVLLKGRWGSSQVGKIYIQDGLSFLPGLTFDRTATEMLQYWNPYSTSRGAG